MTTGERSTAERQYLALQRQARDTARPTDELFQLHGLEGLLARLAVSPYRDQFVLKGGMQRIAQGGFERDLVDEAIEAVRSQRQ